MGKADIKKWFLFQTLQNFAFHIGNLFLSIFIWQNSREPNYLYFYFFTLFLFIPIFVLLGALVSQRKGAKTGFLLAFLIYAFVMGFAALKKEIFLANPLLFGLLNSIAIGLYAISSNTATQIIFSKELSSVNAKQSVFNGINSLVIPLLGSLSVMVTGKYDIVFAIGALALLLSALIVWVTEIPYKVQKWDTGKILGFLQYPDFRKLMFIRFLSGLKGGLEWSVFGVVILKLVGGQIGSWGVIHFVSSLIAILASYFYVKVIAGKKDFLTLLVSSTIYTVFGILLLSDFNLPYFLVYYFFTAITSSFINSSLSKLIGNVYEIGRKGEKASEEFYTLMEFPLVLGRIIPLFILFFIDPALENIVILAGIFFVVSTVPVLTTFLIEKMYSFRREVDIA